MVNETFLGMNYYRFYELDHSDHIEADHLIACGSDADAARAAGRLLERNPAAAVEVWQGPGRVSQLRSGMWQRFLRRWTIGSLEQPGLTPDGSEAEHRRRGQ